MDIYKEKFGASEGEIREALDYGEIGRSASRLSEVFNDMSEMAIKREQGQELSAEEEKQWEDLAEEAKTLVNKRGLLEHKLGA